MADEIQTLDAWAKTMQSAAKRLEGAAPVIGALPFRVTTLLEQGGNWFIQHQHAIIPEKDYRAGESPSYRLAFKPLYQQLPEIKTPTRVSVLYMEDGISAHSQHPLHGKIVAATGAAVWEALTRQPHLAGMLYNRAPYEDTIGPIRKTLLEPGLPDSFKKDQTYASIQAWLKASSYNVISTSTAHCNKALHNKADRLRAEKEITDYFGDNTLFVQSAGNTLGQELEMRHAGFSYHPDTILIGATQTLNDGLPARPRLLHAESYSSYGPDLVCETQPLNARYLEHASMPTYTTVQGTSFSAPQAAVIIQALLTRFAASKENPDAVLMQHDIALALRQTAQAVHVGEYMSLTYQENNKQLIKQIRVGDHVVSDTAGCGHIDPYAAWKQLERMEQAVHESKAHVLPRHERSAALTEVSTKPDAEGNFRYTVEMKDDLRVDGIMLDIYVANRPPFSNPGTLTLETPQGEKIPLFASVHPNESYRMAKSSACYGKSMSGTWTLLSSEPLKESELHFRRAMEPQHVCITHGPDPKKRQRDLYRLADFKTLRPTQLDALLLAPDEKGALPIAQHDFSATRFPAAYLELRLLQLACDPATKAHANALATSQYPVFKAHEKSLIAAIAKDNIPELVATLAPNDNSKRLLVDYVFKECDSHKSFLTLAKAGLNKIKTDNGTPFLNRLVQHMQHNRIEGDPSQVATLTAVMQMMHQQSEPIIQPDATNKTPLDYVLPPAIWQSLQQGIAQEKKLAQMDKEQKAFSAAMEQFIQSATLLNVSAAPDAVSAIRNSLHDMDVKFPLNQASQTHIPHAKTKEETKAKQPFR